jgi:hypothetical protein
VETYALEIPDLTLITGFKNIAHKRPDFIQKIAWLPAPWAKIKDVGNGWHQRERRKIFFLLNVLLS